MLGFIQKYQKTFLLMVALMISVSFLFFGIIPRGAEKVSERTVYKTQNRQKIKQSQFEAMKALLNTHNGEYLLYGAALGPHFFTENFFVSEFLKPGLLGLLVEKNFETFKEDFETHDQKEKKFQAYTHPNAPFLNASTVWSLHAPKLQEDLEELKKETDLKKAFEKKQKLYLEEAKFSPFSLWQILTEQEASFNWIPKDQNLKPQNLQLFGYQSLNDWFGEPLLNKVCEFIFEVNAIAKQKGYQVTLQEAELDLLQLNEQNFMRLKSLGIQDFADSQAYLETKLRMLGLHKMQMVSLWKELLLFKRFFNEASQSALLESSSFESFEKYAGEKIKVARFAPDETLKCDSFKEVMQLEVFLEALGKPLNQLDLNFQPLPLEEVAKKHPELVERSIKIQYKEVNLAHSALAISMQDIWNWKLKPQNYEILVKQFPKLSLQNHREGESIQELLEKLDPMTQMQVDQTVRERLLKENQDWLIKALALAEPQEIEVEVRKNGLGLPFKGLELSEKKEFFLNSFFKSLDLQEVGFIQEPFSFDEGHFYQILAAYDQGPFRLVPFSKLKEEQTLEKLLTKRLHTQSTETSESVLDQKKVAKELFEPLKREIRNDYLGEHKELPADLKEDFYCRYRLYQPMRMALNFMKDHAKEDQPYSLNCLWTLQKRPQTLVRFLSSDEMIEELLPLKEGQWTAVKSFEGELEFMHILSSSKSETSFAMQKQMRAKVSDELKRALAFEMLSAL